MKLSPRVFSRSPGAIQSTGEGQLIVEWLKISTEITKGRDPFKPQ